MTSRLIPRRTPQGLRGAVGYLTQISPQGSYVVDLLPRLLFIGLGMPFAYVAISIGGLAGARAEDAGLTSGLIDTTRQIADASSIRAREAGHVAEPRDVRDEEVVHREDLRA